MIASILKLVYIILQCFILVYMKINQNIWFLSLKNLYEIVLMVKHCGGGVIVPGPKLDNYDFMENIYHINIDGT